jgi:hypothetical protein
MPDERPEIRNWLADTMSRRVRHPALEETLFHRFRDLEQGPQEQLGELVRLVIEELRVAQRRVTDQSADLRALHEAAGALSERLDDLAGRLPAAPPPPAADGHVLMLALPDGYRALVRPGPPPAPGEPVELDGRTFRVLAHGASPYPADRRPCAFALGS